MYRSRFFARAVVALAGLFVLGLSAPAFGHAALTESTPKNGARLDAVPETVEVNYAEPPTQDTRFEVTDGCGNDVARNTDILNQTITADVGSGQPGKWTVAWSVVSAVDGHLTKDKVRFTVTGESDCSQLAESPRPEDPADASDLSALAPIVGATVLIIAVAGFMRWRSRAN